jgi:hypothetical protein
LEGSNDQSNWIVIDRRVNNADMGGHNQTHTWTCADSDFFRYIRFRLEAAVCEGGLYCREVEFFGVFET